MRLVPCTHAGIVMCIRRIRRCRPRLTRFTHGLSARPPPPVSSAAPYAPPSSFTSCLPLHDTMFRHSATMSCPYVRFATAHTRRDPPSMARPSGGCPRPNRAVPNAAVFGVPARPDCVRSNSVRPISYRQTANRAALAAPPSKPVYPASPGRTRHPREYRSARLLPIYSGDIRRLRIAASRVAAHCIRIDTRLAKNR